MTMREVIQRDREERIRMAESDQEEEEDLYDLMFEEDYDFDYITS